MPLLLAVVAPWFIAIGVATGGRFFADAIGGDLARKLSSGDDAHGGWPGLHLLLLPVLLFPATAALPGAAVRAWQSRTAPATRFLIAWIVPAWLVFEAAPTKLPHYPMPLYPAIALLAAAWVLDPARRPLSRIAAALPALVGALLAGAVVALPGTVHGSVWLAAPAVVAALLVGWLAAWGRLLPALLAMPLLYWAALGWELPRLEPLWIAPRVAALAPAPLGSVGFSEPSLMFLAGTGTQWLLVGDGARALADGSIAALLVGDRDLAAVRADLARLGLQPRVLAEVPGFNYSRGRTVLLTLLAR